ncbi:protein of unknown function [Thauera humireducens]|nr:protein of unknown function [Thauera humireducens]
MTELLSQLFSLHDVTNYRSRGGFTGLESVRAAASAVQTWLNKSKRPANPPSSSRLAH